MSSGSVAERFYARMPQHMRELADAAAALRGVAPDTPRLSIALIDHTSLKDGVLPMTGAETPDDIARLCAEAVAAGAAAVCLYPNHIATAKAALAGSNVKLAVVNNFPHGNSSAQEAGLDAAQSIAAATSATGRSAR